MFCITADATQQIECVGALAIIIFANNNKTNMKWQGDGCLTGIKEKYAILAKKFRSD